MKTVEVWRTGRLGYHEAWALQRETAAALKRGEGPERLFLVEHPPVITLGRAADATHVIFKPDGVEVVPTDRGGDVTYHGPGQLVGYPVLDLKPDRCDVGRHLRDLEELLIQTLSRFSIAAGRKPKLTGVWVGDRKIAAMGLHVSRWITTHGFALNVNPDMRHFRWIVPCGIAEFGVVSMQEILGDATPTVEVVAGALCEVFPRIFERCLKEREPAHESQ